MRELAPAILLAATFVTAATLVAKYWIHTAITRACEDAFDLHADEAVALSQPVTGLPVFDAALASLPATQAAVKVRGDLLGRSS